MVRKCVYRGIVTISGVFLIGFALQVFTLLHLNIRSTSTEGGVAQVARAMGWSTSNSTGCTSCTAAPYKKYHVLINSYMNSGSRFTGQLFGFRKDAFYFYEPLWRFTTFDYFHELDQVCSSLKGAGKCQTRTAAKVNQIYQRGTAGTKIQLIPNVTENMTVTELMEDVLYHVYNCDFSKIQNLIVTGVQDARDLAGDGWANFRICSRRNKLSKDICIKDQEALCRKANHVVTKVLRLTTSSMKQLMTRVPNLKVLQLFRDPRAIINSRLESRGYPTNDVTLNAAALCHKMYIDYTGGVELMKAFPGRFRFIFYEDIKDNVGEKMKELYEFIGMDFDHRELDKLNTVKTNAAISRTPVTLNTRVKDNAHWWRLHMSFSRYQAVMYQCKKLVPIFNMTKYYDAHRLQDLEVSALNPPEQFRIKVKK